MQSRLWAAALGRVAGRWRRPLALHVSRCRALSSASQATKLSSKVSDLHRRVMKVPWVDAGETHDVLFEEADAAIAEFRTMYNMSEENRDQLEELYEKTRKFYILKEVAKLCDNYGELFTTMSRSYTAATGALGDNTKDLEPEDEIKLVKALHEYIAFMKSIEDREVAILARRQLGPKALLLRQVVSAESFSSLVAPVAGDHLSF